MKVLDLACRAGHVFEGWFAGEADYQDQRERGLVACPVCADTHVEKRLSAPRLMLGARGGATQENAGPQPGSALEAPHTDRVPSTTKPEIPAALQAAWLSLARKIVANTDDVGPRFAHEARRMHYGEAPERAIRGQASPQEAAQLLDEGIGFLPLALPLGATETLQ